MAASMLRVGARHLASAYRLTQALASAQRVLPPFHTNHALIHRSRICSSTRHCVFTIQPDDDSQRSATASLKETAALDQFIDLLLQAKSEQQMAELVAENILSCDQKFWLRLATRSDTAASSAERDRLNEVANKAMMLVDRIVKETESQLSNSAQVLQDILRAAADDKGEWHWPLAKDRVASMRAAMEERAQHLDEALLSNAFAYIRKVSEDRLDGMVKILQKVLQLYAARQLGRGAAEGPEGVLNEILRAEEDEWVPLIRERAGQGAISEVAFMEALQRKMEATVLSLKSGSYAQMVQAEYLKELEGRAKTVFKELSEKA